MILLLDAGNTHIHAALTGGQNVSCAKPHKWRTADVAAHEENIIIPPAFKMAEITHAVLGSVVPSVTQRIASWVEKIWHVETTIISHQSPGMVLIDYPNPETIGVDRLANAVASARLFGGPCVVIDFGTATTLDVIDSRGAYLGGIIAPGINLMTQYLHEKTELLPHIEIEDPGRWIGKSTVQAMQIGAVYGYVGLIEKLLKGIEKELATEMKCVLLTGGCYEFFHGQFSVATIEAPNLTLDGLRILGQAAGVIP